MARVIPISRAQLYRRRYRNRVLRVLVLAVFGISLIVLSPTQRLASSATSAREAQLPRVINGGGAWGHGKARAPTQDMTPAAPFSLAGQVTRVRDGDTIVVGQTPVRIANLDCAEAGTAQGDRATRRVKALVAGGPVRCTLEGRQSYDREIGTCSMQDGRDLGAVLVQERICGRWQG